jgi:uncharacterized protein (TIGR01777 family)
VPRFTRRTEFPVPVETLFAWHERAGAFERLTPPWDPVTVAEHTGDGIRDGARVVLNVPAGPVTTRWVVEHEGYVPNEQFRDVQRQGPFARWEHTHRFVSLGADRSALEDVVDYALPLGALGRLAGGAFARAKIRRAFDYRHAVTAADLARHATFADHGTMRVAITGSSGLIGSTLAPFLTTAGHTVSRIVRDPARAGPGDIVWDPARGEIDREKLEGVDAVIHLAGEPVSERWTREHKLAIYNSRVQGTGLIARAIAGLARPPRVFVSISAVGIYGDGGDAELDETAPHGRDFLAQVAEQWEASAEPARAAGIRTVHPRLGVVLSPKGGALERLLPPFQLGGGGKIGSGRQWMSWVSLDDTIGALQHLLFTESLSGPVNVTAPNPATNEEFSRTLAHVLGRPALITVPGFALKAMFGEMAEVMLLAGQRVLPRRLLESGFAFRHAALEQALRFELGREG